MQPRPRVMPGRGTPGRREPSEDVSAPPPYPTAGASAFCASLPISCLGNASATTPEQLWLGSQAEKRAPVHFSARASEVGCARSGAPPNPRAAARDEGDHVERIARPAAGKVAAGIDPLEAQRDIAKPAAPPWGAPSLDTLGASRHPIATLKDLPVAPIKAPPRGEWLSRLRGLTADYRERRAVDFDRRGRARMFHVRRDAQRLGVVLPEKEVERRASWFLSRAQGQRFRFAN